MEHLIWLNILLSIVIIFFQRKNPETVWAWLLVLYAIPVAGFLLYLIFGQDYRKSRMFREKEIEGELKYAARRQSESLQQDGKWLPEPELLQFQSLMVYNLNEGQSVLTNNNEIRIFTEGHEKFSTLLEEIHQAVQYIHIQYYIIREDELWEILEEALLKKAAEGVEIRILYDSMGCRRRKRDSFARLMEAGVQVAEFFPAVFGKLQLRLNYRNHRKIVVIDGRIGFVGGFNIGKEYLGLDQKFGHWRDTHLCIEGAAVTSLAVRFVLDWNYAAKENLFQEDRLFSLPVYERNGKELVQIVSSGPDSEAEKIRNNYLRLIHLAKDHIYIQTPYFIPDEDILDALHIAAKSGVDVRIMVPCKPDHPFVYWANHAYLGELIQAGAKCYRYQDGFLHAKGMMADGLSACIGTANMDIRSFRLNFEVNAVLYGREAVSRLEVIFQEDMTRSIQITPEEYQKRSAAVRIREQVCRLLSPLL